MAKIKVSEATGLVLDWLVAKCEGADNLRRNVHKFNNDWIVDWPRDQEGKTPKVEYLADFSPTHSWAQGGPITHRYRININYCRDLRDLNGLYIHAEMETHSYHGYWTGDHNRPLVAAMRCLVGAKLGPVVEVPDELLET